MNEWTRKEWEANISQSNITLFYLYTPMCGTCQVAHKMMEVVQELVDVPIGQANINFIQDVANDYQIESVPCLLITKEGAVVRKIYAFQSVPYLIETIKSIDVD